MRFLSLYIVFIMTGCHKNKIEVENTSSNQAAVESVSKSDNTQKDTMTISYKSIGPYPTHGITMAGALNGLGITLDKIDYIQLVGDESSMTTGLSRKMQIDEFFWDRYFETAEPYKFWYSSGARRLEIYLKGESQPKTTIFINESDSCSAKGDPNELTYMCHGLHRWFTENLINPIKMQNKSQ